MTAVCIYSTRTPLRKASICCFSLVLIVHRSDHSFNRIKEEEKNSEFKSRGESDGETMPPLFASHLLSAWTKRSGTRITSRVSLCVCVCVCVLNSFLNSYSRYHSSVKRACHIIINIPELCYMGLLHLPLEEGSRGISAEWLPIRWDFCCRIPFREVSWFCWSLAFWNYFMLNIKYLKF